MGSKVEISFINDRLNWLRKVFECRVSNQWANIESLIK